MEIHSPASHLQALALSYQLLFSNDCSEYRVSLPKAPEASYQHINQLVRGKTRRV